MRAPLLLALLALPAAGAGRRCPDGSPPSLTGDALTALECPAPKRAATPALEGAPPDGAQTPFGALQGAWEGSFTRGAGRYAATLVVRKTAAGAELVLESKELQMRETARVKLALVVEQAGRYRAKLTSPDAPGAYLHGKAAFGFVPGTKESLADLVFENGAAHRVAYALKGDELTLSVRSALPGASLRHDAVFKRAKTAPKR